jgi:hypothetical protein
MQHTPECHAVEGSITQQRPQLRVVDIDGCSIQHTRVTETNLHTAQHSTTQHTAMPSGSSKLRQHVHC